MGEIGKFAEVRIDGHVVGHSLTPGCPLLVLCRMASRASGIWDGLWHRLSQRFSLASFDLPAPRDAALDDPDALFRAHAATARQIAEALGHPRFRLIGWNGGAHVALRAAVDQSGVLDGIVLLGPFARLGDMRQIEAGLRIMQAMMRQGDRELYAYYWFMGGLSERFLAARFDEVERLARARAEGDRFLTVDVGRMTRWAEILRQDWVTEAELAGIDTPCLIAAPTDNRWNAGPTMEMATLLARRIPSSRLVKLEGLGPLAPLEAPDEVAAAIIAFVEETAS
jgi:pimeloyl-ACP methyl ester carboxylesterase